MTNVDCEANHSEIVRLYKELNSIVKVSDRLCIKYSILLEYMRATGIKKQSPSLVYSQNRDEILAKYSEGLSIRSVAELYGISYSYLSTMLGEESESIIRSRSDAAKIAFQSTLNHVNGSSRSSHELEFESYLLQNSIEYKIQYALQGFRYRYDFYIPHLNLIIEIDGEFWHCLGDFSNKDCASEVHDYDLKKTNVALSLGYKFIRVTDSQIFKYGASLFEDMILNSQKYLINNIISDIDLMMYREIQYRKVQDLERQDRRSAERSAKYSDQSYRGFKLDDHHKYRHDITKDLVDYHLKSRPTIVELQNTLGISRNCMLRVVQQFYNMDIIEFCAQYTSYAEKTDVRIYDRMGELIDLGLLDDSKILTKLRFLEIIKETSLSIYDICDKVGRSRNWLLYWVSRNFNDSIGELIEKSKSSKSN